MKKALAVLLVPVLLAACFAFAAAEAKDEWTCPSCGAEARGNFCSMCGEKRPAEEGWICPECGTVSTGNFCPDCGAGKPAGAEESGENSGKVPLYLEIAFEKNAYFSTYDVKLFIDGEWIATLRHGVDYAGEVFVFPGKHIILFREDGAYPSEGTAVVSIDGPSLYKCAIQAKYNAVQISGEWVGPVPDGRSVPDRESVIAVDGDLKLRLNVEFRKNGMFSTYDVDMYLDDVYIATLPHGKDFEGTLLVSPGMHILVFYRSGSRSVRGSADFTVEKDAFFSCRIEAERNRVDVKNGRLSY